ncbi:MAG: D-3-phosphoglycerate dehydrogenase [Planctomycetota bacterium]|nr:MAG: D-3-phosphoglycerate dehydrogenase [Planctomycetota bacterium]
MSATESLPVSAHHPKAAATRVLVADNLDPAGVELLREAGLDVDVQMGLSPEELAVAAKNAHGILVRSAAKVTADVIAAAPQLRAVGRAGIGVDNIDLDAASERGVLVMNTPLANATTTAELAIAHLFGLARHLARANQSMVEGRWDKKKLVGHELTGKTLCVVGLGKIGRLVAERGVGLKMKVIAHDPFLQGESPVQGVELVSFDDALKRADYLTLHVPKGANTAGLINADALAQMKPSAALINCARGGIVVEADLVAALSDGKLAGAALDVFETEPLPEDSPLRAVPNLLMTPHLGASSSEAQVRVSTEIAAQMIDYLLKGEARCAVNAPSVAPELLAKLRPFMQLGGCLGRMVGQLAASPVVKLEVSYVGELAELETDPLRREVLAGLLSIGREAPVNAVNAERVADDRGLKVLEERTRKGSDYTALLKLNAFTADGTEHVLAGTVWRGQPRLAVFEGFGVDFRPEGTLLVTRHLDQPGVLGQVATWLGTIDVNIGGLHMAAAGHAGEPALAVFETDRALTTDEQKALRELPPIVSTCVLQV